MIKAMSKLSKLLENVDHFYNTAINEYRLSKLAADPPQTWTIEDDEDDEGPVTEQKGSDIYQKLMYLTQHVTDDGAVQELRLLGDQYRTAQRLGDGFNSAKERIDRFRDIQLPMYADDGAEASDLFDEIDEVLLDMRTNLSDAAEKSGAAQKGDSEQAAKAIKKIKDSYDEAERKALFGERGSVSDLSNIDPSAVAQFDLTGGMGMEAAQKGSGKGYFVRTQKDPKDWIETYEKEKKVLNEELPHDTDRNIVNKKQQLIEILEKLKRATAIEAATSEKIESTTGWTEQDDGEGGKVQVAVKPEDQTEIARARTELRELKDQRSALKASLRKDVLTRQQDGLFNQLKGAKDVKSKIIATQKLLLLENLLSQDKNKGAETKARKILISFLEHGDTTDSEVGKATYQKLLDNIKGAEEKKIPIAEFNRQQAAKIKDIKEMGDRKLKFTDVGDFPSQLKRLKQHVPNVKMGDKKEVIDKWREQVVMQANEQERTAFGPQLAALAAAKASKDREQLKAAMSALYTALMNAVEQFEVHASRIAQRMARIERDYTEVNTFRKKLELLDKEGLINKGNLDSAQMQRLHAQLKVLVPEAYELAGRSYTNPFSGKERDSTKKLLEGMYLVLNSHLERTRHGDAMERKEKRDQPPAAKVALEPLGTVENDLTGEIMHKFRDPSTGEIFYRGADGTPIPDDELPDDLKHKKASRGYMNRKQRKIACKQLEKAAFLDTSVPAEVNSLLNDASLNSIEDPNEYAHQVFQKMLASINERMKKMY